MCSKLPIFYFHLPHPCALLVIYFVERMFAWVMYHSPCLFLFAFQQPQNVPDNEFPICCQIFLEILLFFKNMASSALCCFSKDVYWNLWSVEEYFYRIPSNLVRLLISANRRFFENWTTLFHLIISTVTVVRIFVFLLV